jgi:hypothetical protein
MQLVAKSTAYRAPTNYSAITDGQPDAAGRIPTAYGHMTSEQVTTSAIVATQEALAPDALALCFLSMDPSTKDWFLSLLTAYHNQSDNDCNALDSRSSKHLQDTMCAINTYSYHSCSSGGAAYIEAAATPTHNGIAAQEAMSRWHHQMDPKADNASAAHNHQLIGTHPSSHSSFNSNISTCAISIRSWLQSQSAHCCSIGVSTMDPNSDNCSISGGAVNIDSITTLCSVETQSDQLVLTSSMARSSNPTLTIQNSTNVLADGLITPNASRNHQMDPKADNAPIGHHHHLSDVNPDTDATSAGHHGLNNVDSGAGDAGAEHHQTSADIGKAPSQLPNDDRHHQSEAQKFTATCVGTESNSGLSQDDRLHQTATHIYAGAAPALHTQSRMTTESCYLAALALPITQHFNQPLTHATLQVSQQPEPLTHAATNDDVQLSLVLIFATTIVMVHKITVSSHCRNKTATQRVKSLHSHLQGKEQLTSFQWIRHWFNQPSKWIHIWCTHQIATTHLDRASKDQVFKLRFFLLLTFSHFRTQAQHEEANAII